MLVHQVMAVTEQDWNRLKDEDSPEKYEWSEGVEGFFKQLGMIPFISDRFYYVQAQYAIDKKGEELADTLVGIGDGIQAVFSCKELQVIFRKILTIGNYLNSGSENLGR